MSSTSLPDNQREWEAGDTPYILVTLLDGNGAPITLANILTLTLTQWVDAGPGKPGVSINSRNLQDVKNANGVTIDATSGLVTWQLSALDTAIQSKDTSVVKEKHQFRFDLTYTSTAGTQGASYPDFYVVNRLQTVR